MGGKETGETRSGWLSDTVMLIENNSMGCAVILVNQSDFMRNQGQVG